MASFPSPKSVIFNNFKGIRTRNGIAGEGTISATTCQNVDFLPSSFDAGIDIKTTLGNYKYCELSDTYEGYNIIKGFEFETENGKLLIFYCENTSNGILLKYDGTNGFIAIIDDTYDLTVTGQANGITMIDNAYNTFIFTNGVEYYAYCPDSELPENVIQQLEPEYDGNPITGLSLAEQDGSLVIGCNEGLVLASRKGDITDFDYVTPTDINKAWYQLFGKKVTAVVPYIDSLLVFTQEDSTVLSGNFSTTSGTRYDASLGGCMSFESWCKHDKYLFFYDNKQKNIYYYMQNDFGQKVLGEPIAPEVQKFFNNVTKLQIVSYVGNNRSEIWFLANNFKLIYDYYVSEWSERVCQNLTSYFVYDNDVYSTGGAKCFIEKAGNTCIFDGEFYPATYAMQLINLGSFSNMKEMEFQPLISVSSDYNNTFDIDCEIDGKKVKSKRIKMYNQGAVWGDDEAQTAATPDNEIWDVQYYPDESDKVIQQVKGKFISNWYYLRFIIKTTQRGDDFAITQFELKGITQETDTTGRK